MTEVSAIVHIPLSDIKKKKKLKWYHPLFNTKPKK